MTPQEITVLERDLRMFSFVLYTCAFVIALMFLFIDMPVMAVIAFFFTSTLNLVGSRVAMSRMKKAPAVTSKDSTHG